MRACIAVLGCFAALAGCRARPTPVLERVPPGASVVAWIAPPQSVLPVAREFLAGLGAGEGLYEYVRGHWGADLSSADALEAVGVSASTPAAAFLDDSAWGFALGVRRGGALQAAVARWARTAGVCTCEEGAQASMACRCGKATGLALAVRRADGWVAVAATVEAARNALNRWTRESAAAAPVGGAAALARVVRGSHPPHMAVWADLSPGSPVRGALNAVLAGAPAPVQALAGVLVGGRAAVVHTTLAPERVTARATVSGHEGHGWWAAGPATFEPAAYLPRDTVLAVRARLDAAAVRAMPRLVLRMAVPRDALRAIHPALGAVDPLDDVLPYVTGDVTVALTGIRHGVSLAELLRAAPARVVADRFDWVVAAEIRDAGALAAHWAQRAGALSGSGLRWERLAVRGRGVRALAVSGGGGRRTGVFVVPGGVLLAVGSGAIAAVRAVVEGRAAPLREALDTRAGRLAGGAGPVVVGLVATTRGLVRQLDELSAPPYVLHLLGSVWEVAAAVQFDGDTTVLDAEVEQ